MRFPLVNCNISLIRSKRIKIHSSYTLDGLDFDNIDIIKFLEMV